MNVGDDIVQRRANWSFDGKVADTFVEHARKSIPGYDEGHAMICALSDFFCMPDSRCYEIGTSTGQLIAQLAHHHAHKPSIQWVGIDPVQAMIDKASAHCASYKNISMICEDIRLLDLENADLIVAYYTLQFIPPKDRQHVIDKIYHALNWGGGFIWFEKVRGPDARFQDILVNLYTSFKIQNGFSADEIIAKAESIKGVMEPFSSQGNLDLLKRAGFVDIMPVFRHACFEGLLCIK